jgi:pimeloyl-ACP methyl ester carboxylesterase
MAGAVRRPLVTTPRRVRRPSRAARVTALAALLALLALLPAAPVRAAAAAASLGCANVTQPVIVTGTTPVLFVHGIDSDPTIWTQGSVGLTLEPPLDYVDSALGTRAQVTGYTFDWSSYSGFKSGSNLAWTKGPPAPGPGPLLAQAIKCVAGKSGHKVIIIAHSMGGLLTEYASTIGSVADSIAAVFTLGTPFQGSWLDSAANGPFLSVSQTIGATCAFAGSLNSSRTGTKQHAKPSGGIEALCRVVSQRDDPGMKAMMTDAAPGTGWRALDWPGGFPVFPLAASIQQTSWQWRPLLVYGPSLPLPDLGDGVVSTSSELNGGTEPTTTCTVPAATSLVPPVFLGLVATSPCFHTNEPDNQALLDNIINTVKQYHLITPTQQPPTRQPPTQQPPTQQPPTQQPPTQQPPTQQPPTQQSPPAWAGNLGPGVTVEPPSAAVGLNAIYGYFNNLLPQDAPASCQYIVQNSQFACQSVLNSIAQNGTFVSFTYTSTDIGYAAIDGNEALVVLDYSGVCLEVGAQENCPPDNNDPAALLDGGQTFSTLWAEATSGSNNEFELIPLLQENGTWYVDYDQFPYPRYS